MVSRLLFFFDKSGFECFFFFVFPLAHFDGPLGDPVEVLSEADAFFLSVGALLVVAEDGFDFVVQVAVHVVVFGLDIEQFKSVFHRYVLHFSLVVHQELHQVEELARL